MQEVNRYVVRFVEVCLVVASAICPIDSMCSLIGKIILALTAKYLLSPTTAS